MFDKHEKRVALLDRDRSITYGELDRMSDNLALNLLEVGFRPLDRFVVQLPNVAEFVILYLALQKIGGILIAALMPHRYRGNQPVRRAFGRRGMRRSRAAGGFRLLRHGRPHPPESSASCATGLFLGPARPGFSFADRSDRKAGRAAQRPRWLKFRSIRRTRASFSFPAARLAFRS